MWPPADHHPPDRVCQCRLLLAIHTIANTYRIEPVVVDEILTLAFRYVDNPLASKLVATVLPLGFYSFLEEMIITS